MPEALAEARPEALRKLGFSHQKSRALIELAQKISDNAINLDELEDRSDDVALKQLRELRGIGRWSADRETLPGSLQAAGIGYVHMLGLGGLRHARHDSPNTAWRSASFRGLLAAA